MSQASGKALMLVSLLGLACILATLYGAVQWEAAFARGNFEKTASERRELIQRAVDSNLEALYAVRGLFYSSQLVERAEFAAFASETLTRHPEISSLEWRPRVVDAQRASFEAAASRPAAPPFAIHELDASGQVRPAAKRAFYLPVLFAEPFAALAPRLGLDSATETNPDFGAVRAASANDLYAAPLGQLPTNACAGDARTICVYLPVYHYTPSTEEATDRVSHVSGFVVMGLRMDRLLADSLGRFAVPEIAIEFRDDVRQDSPAWLTYGPPTTGGLADADELRWPSTVALGRQHFGLLFSGARDPFRSRPWSLWLVFGAGLLAFALSGGYLWATQASRRRIGRLVLDLRHEAHARGLATDRLMRHEQQLQRQNAALVELVRRRAASLADERQVFASITEIACDTLGVARAGVWLYNADRSALECADLFLALPHSHEANRMVWRGDCPDYFAAIEQERILAAHDAESDPRTAELTEGYLRPLGVGALLDAPIIRSGVTSGVLCCEHIGGARTWDASEEAFAGSLAEYTALVIETREREASDQQRNNLAAIIEALPDGVAIAAADQSISYVNHAARQLLGMGEPSAGAGRTLRQLFSESARQRFDAISLPAAMKVGLWSGEIELDINGDSVPAHQTLIVHRDAKGEVRFLSTLLRDLRAEKAAEALTFERERFLSALLANLPGVVYRRRNAPNWPMEYISPGCLELTGYSADRILSGDPVFSALVHPDDLPRVQQAINAALEERRFFELEYRITRADGAQVWLWSKGHGIYADDGSLLAREAFIGDVTERVVAQHKLEQLNAELEQRIAERTARLQEVNQNLESFAYSVSHDLKAPLRGIDGYSRLLLEDYLQALPEEAQQFLGNIRGATVRMNQLIDDLLAYSRLDRRALSLVSVSLGTIFDKILAEREFDIGQVGAVIDMSVDALTVTADQEGLLMILRNLVDNALKFCRDRSPPLISISASTHQGKTRICVKDNGCGFDMKYAERIFEIFQRLHRVEEYAGTGIGLAMVRKAAERMGGKVWARSERGKGAEFFVELPP